MTPTPFEDLALGARFRLTLDSAHVWVKIGHNLIAEWDGTKVRDRWIGQPICCFSDTDDLTHTVHVLD